MQLEETVFKTQNIPTATKGYINGCNLDFVIECN